MKWKMLHLLFFYYQNMTNWKIVFLVIFVELDYPLPQPYNHWSNWEDIMSKSIPHYIDVKFLTIYIITLLLDYVVHNILSFEYGLISL